MELEESPSDSREREDGLRAICTLRVTAGEWHETLESAGSAILEGQSWLADRAVSRRSGRLRPEL